MPALVPIQHRRGTAAQWAAANPVLLAGEPGYETDTGREKRGNGSTAWNGLPYFAASLYTDGIDGGQPGSTYTASELDGGSP